MALHRCQRGRDLGRGEVAGREQLGSEMVADHVLCHVDVLGRVRRFGEGDALGPAFAVGRDRFQDEDVPFGAFATVMDAVKGSGITNVSIVTQPLESHGQH